MNLPIYLDNHATTMVDPQVMEVMLPYFTQWYGNPSSRMHSFGEKAGEAVDAARIHVQKLINAKTDREIIFTAGATEAINHGIKGAARTLKDKGRHIITSVVEHKAVLKACAWLEGEGYEVTSLPTDSTGQVSVESVKNALRDDTILVAVMAANNEVGTVNPIGEIGALLADHQAAFFVDAAQAAGKIPLDVQAMHIDMLSLSAHKYHGPKGVGALYISRKSGLKLQPLLHGGGQERNRRSGTLNVPGIVGMGEASRIALQDLEESAARIRTLRDRLQKHFEDNVEEIIINGHPTDRLPGNLNISFTFIEGEGMAMRLRDHVAVSTGSACSSDTLEASYVLLALGLKEMTAHASIRMGLSKFTTEEEVDYIAEKMIAAVNDLREMSPLWQMHKDGVDLDSIEWSDH